VTDDERRAVFAPLANVGECARHSRHDVLIRLEAVWLAAGLQESGPLPFDFTSRETLPWANVCLLQPLVHLDGTNAEMLGDDRRGVSCPLQLTGSNEVEVAEVEGCIHGLAHTFVAEWNVGSTLPPFLHVPQGLSVTQHEERADDLATLHGNAG
jgi:hypothetical protein